MPEWLKYAIDAEVSESPHDLREWWKPFVCLGLTISVIGTVAVILTTVTSYLLNVAM